MAGKTHGWMLGQGSRLIKACMISKVFWLHMLLKCAYV
jgi:hypothetical protein